MQRCFRDAYAAVQHVQVQSGNFETVGRVLLGMEPGAPARGRSYSEHGLM